MSSPSSSAETDDGNMPSFGNEPSVSRERLSFVWKRTHDHLNSHRQPQGHWVGGLSTSALSTATAVSAMVQTRKSGCVQEGSKETVDEAIQVGARWLAEHQNRDGGFGDTDRSHSNIATTLLVLAAWELAEFAPRFCHDVNATARDKAWNYVETNGKWEGLRRRYGKDKTFVVPILANCAIAGLVPWEQVPALPFEAAWLPQDLYRWARMPVVSYAVPALVAIGQARFFKVPPRNPLWRSVRKQAVEPTLRALHRMQPASGGYLEATPLTSFVLMSLASVGNGGLPVAQECLRFILDSRLEDGSWPIDTNLATWLTSLSTLARSRVEGQLYLEEHRSAPEFREHSESAIATRVPSAFGIAGEQARDDSGVDSKPKISSQCVDWLLRCQHHQRHPFTGANPGGWGWTDLSGAVPDADDTPAALLALNCIHFDRQQHPLLSRRVDLAVLSGLRWLLRLQNRDGGWPTFCRGWGKLPFDRSGTDLTAHALRAFHAWQPKLEQIASRELGKPEISKLQGSMARAAKRGFNFLERNQHSDGSWLPLWFGNQDRSEEDNPIYGTAKVLMAYAELGMVESGPAVAAVQFLRESQNEDGGWGGGPSILYPFGVDFGLVDGGSGGVDESARSPDYGGFTRKNDGVSSTIEETALALEGLIACGGNVTQDATIMRGLEWLCGSIEKGGLNCAWPIGFYFAKLWYYEDLYPAIFSLGALGSALLQWDERAESHAAVAHA